MPAYVSQTISALSILVLFANIFSVLLSVLFGIVTFSKFSITKKILNVIQNNAIYVSLLVASVATIGSLFLSEIAHFAPCKLCWEQRIFMYPLPIIMLISLLTDDTKVRKYILPLATIGFLIATYHILLQTFPQALQCSDELISCTKKYTAHFGYITVPVMSASAFITIILLQSTTFFQKK